jgi:pimeloyl-ACP methyl ester carboxylesterase
MPRALLQSGIELEYETIGSPDDEALLLVMGFTAQLIVWPDDFCKMLADAGRYVIRYDNRDCGLSTKLDGQIVDTAALMTALMTGAEAPAVPYTLSDMAADGIGLLDHLGIDRAHIVGASMGGMIVQTMAIEHPERIRSMVSVMSTTGEREYGQADPEAMSVLLTPAPTDRQGYIDASPRTLVFQSKKYGDVDKAKLSAAASYDRSFYPEGAGRQMGAIFASGDRAAALPGVTVPTLVIHGRDDTLIAPSGGERTAALIPGAHLLMVGDMGHDLPEPLFPVIADAIIAHTRHAR